MNNKGISIIAVLIAIGLTGILSSAITSLFGSQYRETKALQEKLASLDLEKLLIQTLGDGSVCKYIMNKPTPKTFNSQSPLPIKINSSSPIYANADFTAGTHGPIIAEVGKLVSPISQSLTVESIELELLERTGNTFLGQWVVSFSNENTVRHIKPIYVSTIVLADTSTPTASTIENCQSEDDGANSYGYAEGPYDTLRLKVNSNGKPFALFYSVSKPSGGGLLAGNGGPYSTSVKVLQDGQTIDSTGASCSVSSCSSPPALTLKDTSIITPSSPGVYTFTISSGYGKLIAYKL